MIRVITILAQIKRVNLTLKIKALSHPLACFNLAESSYLLSSFLSFPLSFPSLPLHVSSSLISSFTSHSSVLLTSSHTFLTAPRHIHFLSRFMHSLLLFLRALYNILLPEIAYLVSFPKFSNSASFLRQVITANHLLKPR
jgi:hypothetical protein